jgi:cyclic pyranopterin phosphate synthase
MAATPLDTVVFSFEGLLPLLDSPPIAARRALDHAGLRLSVEGWRSLTLDERQHLCEIGATERIDPPLVVAALHNASPAAQRVPPGGDPDASTPPEALVHALEPGRALDPKRWSRLRALDRYALSHTYRRAVARSAFAILGEAFDSIVASASAGAHGAPPSSAPNPSSGASSSGAASSGVPSSGAPAPISPLPRRAVTMPSKALGHAPVSSLRTRADEEQATPIALPPESPLSTHLSASGEVRMVDVAAKPKTERRAVASGSVRMKPETIQRITQNAAPKGEVLATARIAGIMAAKRTSELIPLCHIVALTKVKLDIAVDVQASKVDITAVAEAVDRTGVEMEAMVAVSVACLTIYDMLKGVDREMVVSEIKLLEKSGGKSGHFCATKGTLEHATDPERGALAR